MTQLSNKDTITLLLATRSPRMTFSNGKTHIFFGHLIKSSLYMLYRCSKLGSQLQTKPVNHFIFKL